MTKAACPCAGQAAFVFFVNLQESGVIDMMGMLPAIDMAATGENIARMRRKAGLTVQALQAIFGFSTPQAIYKWQRGAAMPTLDNMLILSAVFHTTIDEIVVRTDASAGQRSA